MTINGIVMTMAVRIDVNGEEIVLQPGSTWICSQDSPGCACYVITVKGFPTKVYNHECIYIGGLAPEVRNAIVQKAKEGFYQ